MNAAELRTLFALANETKERDLLAGGCELERHEAHELSRVKVTERGS